MKIATFNVNGVNGRLPVLEEADMLKHRIDEAAKFVSLGQRALSPQCGFLSIARVGRFPLDQVERKLALIVRVARDVWGEA
jgi:5-methyltetrahydropteroyltriglutamate--homocysteine methyltransferase